MSALIPNCTDLIELGGPRDSFDITENSEVFHGIAASCEAALDPNEEPDDRFASLLVLMVEAAVDCRFLTASGIPSHLELTLGTVSGSLLLVKVPLVLMEELEGDTVPFPLPCLRCCSANCSRAAWDGSFSDRKLKTELLFFFFFVVLESLELEWLEGVEARLDDVLAVVSKDGRYGEGGASELVADICLCSDGRVAS